MANKIYDPKIKGVHNSNMAPKLDLHHVKRSGFHPGQKLGMQGLHNHAVSNFMANHSPGSGSAMAPATGVGKEASPAGLTISLPHESRGRMGGLSNLEFKSKERKLSK